MSLNVDWITLNGSGSTSVSKLGIGTTDPQKELDVVGDINSTGTVSATSLSGTLSTAAQPNITSVGTLSSLNAGDINYTGTLTQNGTPVSFGGSSVWTQSGSSIYYNSGNVGIGTNNPSNEFTVYGSDNILGIYSTSGECDIYFRTPNGNNWQVGSNATGDMFYIFSNAYDVTVKNHRVGIYTSDPLFPLHVAGTNSGSESIGSHGFLNSSGAGTFGSAFAGAQAKFTGIVHAELFRALSDARIKKDITLIDDNEALSKLRLIEPKKYRYIDTVTKGDREVYGFIAQEVAAQFPEAVGKETSFLPNVYSAVTPDLDNEYISFPSGGAVDGILEIYTSKGRREITVSYVSTNTVRFQSGDIKADDLVDGKIFVYGYRMDDVHALNKDYLFTINFAATQELDRRNQELTLKVTSLESELRSLKNTLTEKGIL